MAVREFNLDREKVVCDVHHVDGSIYRGCDFANSVNDRVFNFWFENNIYCIPFSQIKKIISYEKE